MIFRIFKSFAPYAIAAAELLAPQVGLAQQIGNVNITGPTGILCTVATAMFWILVTLSTIMVLYAAFIYLTSGDNAQNVTKAHKTLAYAALAIIVAFLAKGFPALVASVVGQSLPAGSTC